MIFGKMRKSSNYFAAFIGIVILLFNQSSWADNKYVDVIESLSQQSRDVVKYEEIHEAFYLEKPLLSKGVMRFEPPDKLIKTVIEPESVIQVIEGDMVVVKWDNGKTERFSLEQHPGLKTMAYTLRSLLTGNASYFEENFKVEYSENEENWKLVLIPIDTNVKKWIKDILITGKNRTLNQFIITEVNGDRTTTRLYE